MPPAAIIAGAAVVGAGASYAAAKENKKAINKSTDASLQANQQSIAAQKEALDKQLAAQQNALNQSLSVQTNAYNANSALGADMYNSTGKLNTDIYNQNIGILNPYAQTGSAAMNQLDAILGLPKQQAYNPKQLSFTPVTAPTIAAPPVAAAPATPAAPTVPAPAAQVPAVPTNYADALRAAYAQAYP